MWKKRGKKKSLASPDTKSNDLCIWMNKYNSLIELQHPSRDSGSSTHKAPFHFSFFFCGGAACFDVKAQLMLPFVWEGSSYTSLLLGGHYKWREMATNSQTKKWRLSGECQELLKNLFSPHSINNIPEWRYWNSTNI